MTRIEALRSAITIKADRANALRASLAEYATRDGEPTNEERSQFAADLAEFDAVGPELEALRSELAQLEAVLAAPVQAREVVAPQVMVRQADPIADESVQYGTVDQVRGAARTAVERLPLTDDSVRERVYKTLERADDPTGKLSRHVIAASRPAYRSAFSKLISGNTWALTAEEQRAVEHVRAASLTDAAGGYAVPVVTDPTILATGAHDGLTPNPMRQAARVTQTTADNFNVLSTAGITASWDGEAGEVSDDAPTLAQTTVTPYKAQGFVPFSIELQQDWPAMEAEMSRLLMIARDDLEHNAFLLGNGSNAPLGLIYDVYTNYSGQLVTSATTDTFAIADVYSTIGKVAARYRSRGSWIANELVYDLIRRFDTNGGAGLWTYLDAARPGQLLGRPAYASGQIDGTVTASADNYILVFGDLQAAYTIVDRVGMTVELVPHMLGSNRRPNGQRGLYAYWRTGGRVIDSTAVGVLNVT
jgi:HK97 family phage major capsid protein